MTDEIAEAGQERTVDVGKLVGDLEASAEGNLSSDPNDTRGRAWERPDLLRQAASTLKALEAERDEERRDHAETKLDATAYFRRALLAEAENATLTARIQALEGALKRTDDHLHGMARQDWTTETLAIFYENQRLLKDSQ
jgi:hypothetical protein